MGLALKKPEMPGLGIQEDRPGWIPADILYDWDTCPYAYQTEEELMPAGGLHGYLLLYIAEILRSFLASRNRMLLMDTFLLYRDARGTKQRISPDLMLMPFRFPPPSAYDLDEESPPLAVVEVTSPKSRIRDLKEKVFFYSSLGISSYLVIDAVTASAKLRPQIELHLWRQISGKLCRIRPDSEGWLTVPEMDLMVRADGQRLFFRDRHSGEILCDLSELKVHLSEIREKADAEKKRAEMAQKAAEAEKIRADEAHKAAECERIRADEAQKAAEAEKIRADEAHKAAECERIRADEAQKAAEAEKIRADEAHKAAECERIRAEEAQKSAESEKIRAEEAEKSAEIEREKNRMILEKLRALGIDPESFHLQT